VAISTRDPPCEQWLAGLGVGAGLSFVAWCSTFDLHHSSFVVCRSSPIVGGDMAISTRDPPCKQWHAGLGAGAGMSFVAWCSFMAPTLPSLSSVHPRSTPQAVARGAGGRWCLPSFLSAHLSLIDSPASCLDGEGAFAVVVGHGPLCRFLSFFVVLWGRRPYRVGFRCK
jgi:hypothetical protein